MSNYTAPAYDPVSKKVRDAWWMDDYFGRHCYGVRFDDDGPVYRPSQVRIPEHLKEEWE